MKIRKCPYCNENLMCVPFRDDDEPDSSQRYRCVWRCMMCGHQLQRGFISAGGLKQVEDLVQANKKR